MRYDLIIQGATVCFPDGERKADLGINDGRISGVGNLGGEDAEITLDASHLHVLPGVIDTQVHFREPGLEHKEDIESGTRAALMGGVTTIFDMPNTNPPTTSDTALEDKLHRAAGRAWCNYAFFIGATSENVVELAEYENLPGTPGIKIFVGSSTGSLLVDEQETLRRVLKNGKRRCPVHAEDETRLRERKAAFGAHPHVREHPNIRDAEAAKIATQRVLALSEETGRPVHILHVSTADELPLLNEAKKRGLDTSCEVTPQHLTFNEELYERIGTLAQMNPPIRAESHRQALWRALKEGLFDVLGSDHAPHTLEEKAKDYPSSPSGMPGVQTLLPVMLDWVHRGELSLMQLVQMSSQNPASIYGIEGKGRIEVGYDADLVIIDLSGKLEITKSWLESRCGWSPFEGMTLTGKPLHVILGGRLAVRDGQRLEGPSGRPARFVWKES